MLAVADLCAGYGSAPVLDRVSFRLGGGEILALLGRNGVGKSTLLRAITGLLRPTSGVVEFDGRDVTARAPHRIARAQLAYVPQGRGIFAKLTVLENLMAGTRARPDAKPIVPPEVFAYFPVLKERLNQLGGTLSGGEQQMLAFARALCGAPRAMLLDEPSEGIQPNIVFELGTIMSRLAKSSGLAILLVEQNIDLALAVADRVLVMEKGRIVHEGEPQSLRDDETLRRLLAI